ncbi:MAG: hypothetical protein EXQ93_07365 [Alphaproteobacteria bacterium]|nr:hypothetical protein [Alphaproteobacteria bacterium]
MRGLLTAATLALAAVVFVAGVPVGGVAAQDMSMKGMARALQADQIVIGTQRVSLYGIDAPDPDQDRECLAGRTFFGCYTNAKRALEILVSLGPVECTDSGERNYINFPYMTCKLGQLDIAEDLVRQGWAFAFKQQSPKYVEAEAEARAAKKGMWQTTIRFTFPWEWREINGRPLYGP